MVEDVKEMGGDVHIFSSMHVSGDQLKQLTGIVTNLIGHLRLLEYVI